MGRGSRRQLVPVPRSSSSQCILVQNTWLASWLWSHQPSGTQTWKDIAILDVLILKAAFPNTSINQSLNATKPARWASLCQYWPHSLLQETHPLNHFSNTFVLHQSFLKTKSISEHSQVHHSHIHVDPFTHVGAGQNQSSSTLHYWLGYRTAGNFRMDLIFVQKPNDEN